jgi:hypothetical protein
VQTLSAASPDRSAMGEPGAFSSAHQPLAVLLPSVWCDPVVAPHRNPSGNEGTSGMKSN